MKVLLVMATRSIRARLARELVVLPQLVLLGLADDLRQALDLAIRLEPDVIIVDFALPDEAGVDLLLALARLPVRSRLLVVAPPPLASYEHASSILGVEACFSHVRSAQDLPAFLCVTPPEPSSPSLETS